MGTTCLEAKPPMTFITSAWVVNWSYCYWSSLRKLNFSECMVTFKVLNGGVVNYFCLLLNRVEPPVSCISEDGEPKSFWGMWEPTGEGSLFLSLNYKFWSVWTVYTAWRTILKNLIFLLGLYRYSLVLVTFLLGDLKLPSPPEHRHVNTFFSRYYRVNGCYRKLFSFTWTILVSLHAGGKVKFQTAWIQFHMSLES